MADDEIIIDTIPAGYSVIEIVTDPIAEFQIEVQGPRGKKGDKGDPGQPSVGAYEPYEFPDKVFVWEGAHPYVGRPMVIIRDLDGNPLWAPITYPQVKVDINDPTEGLVVVTFLVAQSGTMEIRA